jgi:hypothetical protein
MEILEYISHLNWQTIIAIFAVNWWFYHELRKKIEVLEERMFYLSTGKTLAQAILEEKQKTK